MSGTAGEQITVIAAAGQERRRPGRPRKKAGEAEVELKPPKKLDPKRPKLKEITARPSEYVGKYELAYHLQANIASLAKWIENKTIPPPWFRTGTKHPLWRRDHFDRLKQTGAWPKAAFHSRPV